MLRLGWSVEVRRVYREANFVADGVANWVLPKPIGSYPLPEPHAEISKLVLVDVAGVSRVRLVSNNPGFGGLI